MKTAKILKELLIGSIVISPLIYFFYLWNTLPNEIPIHFDAQGNPNNYGPKSFTAWTLSIISIGTYLLLLVIPKIDPKKNFPIFNNTFIKLRFILSIFFSAICFITIFSTQEKVLNTSHFYITFAILIIMIGNYMSNIRPNYFLGIRTPWALESETNWKKTHFVSGRLWFISGIALIVLMLISPHAYKSYIFLSTIALISIFPFLFSYFIFRKENRTTKNHTTKNQKSEYWFGMIYFNRDDSRILVPKRFGIGWTFNLGNPYTYIIIIAIVALLWGAKYIR